jgi:GTP-binding protein
MLISSKAEVKTSARPGHTQTINFFVINESLSFADLPGFGYAKAPGAIKDSFLPMIRSYIEARETLRVAFLLIDIRRTPGEEEQEILAALSKRGISTAVVVTKADKLSNNQLKQRIRGIAEELQINEADIFVSSSLKKSGRADLLKLIGQFSER